MGQSSTLQWIGLEEHLQEHLIYFMVKTPWFPVNFPQQIPIRALSSRDLKQMCKEKGVDPWIEIDGGASGGNAKEIKDAGCNAIVAGSAVFNAPSYADAVKAIKEA